MNIWFHKYEKDFNGRKIPGVLLKFYFNPKLTGYSCLQPWEELGDLPLERQLKNLQSADLNSVLKQCFYFAQLDAEARAKGEHLLENAQIPASHFLISDVKELTSEQLQKVAQSGYKLIKLKTGNSLPEELEKIKSVVADLQKNNIKLRLDFNSKTSFDSLMQFFEQLKTDVGDLNFIDLVEDPCEDKEEAWLKIKKQFGLTLAADRELAGYKDADVIVIKPTIQFTDEAVQFALASNKKIYFTSNLDHPVGVNCAVFDAARIYLTQKDLVLPGGLPANGAQQLSGSGFGFDSELENLKWEFLL